MMRLRRASPPVTITALWCLTAVACGSRSQDVDTTRDRHDPAKGAKEAEVARPSDPSPEADTGDSMGDDTPLSPPGDVSPNAELDAITNPADVASEESAVVVDRSEDDARIAELAAKPSVNPMDADELVPLCATPTEAELGFPTYGTEAVRLHWKPETGECTFTSGDGTPDGWSGILTFRRRGEDTFLSTLGRWRYYAPTDLDLDDLAEGETFTFYPYLDDWQFIVDVRYDGQLVTIERFEYIQGEPPDDYGLPDRTSNDPPPGPMLIPCSSLDDEGGAE